MKTYADEKIEFSYPETLRLIEAKRKWGQYDLRGKDGILIIICILSQDSVDSFESLIRNCFIDELDKRDYFELVEFGKKRGFGEAITSYDNSGTFIEKRYRLLFPVSTGGLYIEIIGYKDFSIDEYKELLESIKVKDSGGVPSIA